MPVSYLYVVFLAEIDFHFDPKDEISSLRPHFSSGIAFPFNLYWVRKGPNGSEWVDRKLIQTQTSLIGSRVHHERVT